VSVAQAKLLSIAAIGDEEMVSGLRLAGKYFGDVIQILGGGKLVE